MGGLGGGSDGEPEEGAGMVYGRGSRDDRSKEFTLVNPRNINIPVFTGKSLTTNPYLPCLTYPLKTSQGLIQFNLANIKILLKVY